MSHEEFTGTGVAIVTPFRNDGSIDFNLLVNCWSILSNEVVNYEWLGRLGTTVVNAVRLPRMRKRL